MRSDFKVTNNYKKSFVLVNRYINFIRIVE